MKRLEQEPTPEVLAESIGQDEVGRNNELADFIRLLNETEGPFSLLLDAHWGEGKTFFVKSAELVVNALNDGATSQAENKRLPEDLNLDDLRPVMNQFGTEQVSILPFYFNAWENDFAEDPMIALFACMAVAFGQEGLTKETKVGKAVAGIVDAATGMLPCVPKTGLQSLITALSSDDLIGAYRKRAELREKIDFLAENALPEVANKLVIFIDELDRCRPDFAVKLLEQTKALFQSERVIVVTVADSIQLAHAVAGQYGDGFDSTRFLDRFFDMRLRLEHVDPCEVIDKTHMLGSGDMLENLIGEIISAQGITIREYLHLNDDFKRLELYCRTPYESKAAVFVARYALLPLLIYLRQFDVDTFERITQEKDPDLAWKAGSKYRGFKKMVFKAAGILRNENVPTAEEKDVQGANFVHNLCVAIYDEDYMTREEARKSLGISGSEFDSNIYKRLRFPDAM